MAKPKYTLTPHLLQTISQIERLYGQLEGMKIPQKLELNLNRDNLIRSSYISNSIEGNPLSEAEVTNLLLGGRVPANRDEQEVRNYFDILKELHAYKESFLDLSLVLTIHQKLLRNVDNAIAGEIRNKQVVVGGYEEQDGAIKLKIKHNPPAHQEDKIKQTIHSLNDWYQQDKTNNIIIKIGSYHHEFVYIHPFEDGNGRVCRLLTALLFLKAEYAINKYFVLDDYYDLDRSKYSDMLNTADTGDKTQWLEYFLDGVLYSLQSAKGRMETQIDKLSIEDRPSDREKDVLSLLHEQKELTSGMLAQRLGVSRQQAHNLLANLVEKGLVEKKGKTKGSYYRLK